MKTLPVPYKSQWDDDAKGTQSDCGPCSVAMVLGYYGTIATTDEVYKLTGAGKGLITISQLQKAINHYGYTSQYLLNQYEHNIKASIDNDIPVIALIRYKDLPNKQDKYAGSHFFVVVGYNQEGYVVNDPDFWGDRRSEGERHLYKYSDFNNAWTNEALTGNPANSMLIINPPKEIDMSKYKDADVDDLINQVSKDTKNELKDLSETKAKWIETWGFLEGDRKKVTEMSEKIKELENNIVKLEKEKIEMMQKVTFWDNCKKAYKIENFTELSAKITALENSNPDSNLPKSEHEKIVKEMKEKYEERVMSLQSQLEEMKMIKQVSQYTATELLSLFIGKILKKEVK